MISVHCQRGVLSVEQEIVRKQFLEKVWIRYIQNADQFLMIQKKLRLGFLFADLSQHIEIYLVAFGLKLFVCGQEAT